MRRRTLLTAAAGAAAGLAGCLGGPGPGDTPDDGRDPADGTDRPTRDGTATATDGGRTTDDPEPAFPPFADDVAEVVWYRDVSDPDGRLHLEPSAASASLPAADLSFTLRNPTDRPFATNFYDWTLYRKEGGFWYRVAPTVVPEPLMRLDPGGEHTWSVRVENTALASPVHRSQGTGAVTVTALGGGTYAFAASGWWPDQEATPTYEHRTVAAARFALEGPALELTQSSAVTDTRREGDRVVVEAEAPTGGDEGDAATYALSRVDGKEPDYQLVTEQVYREWPLRDALASFESGVTEVRVDTTTTTVPPFGVAPDERPRVAYDGAVYEVSAARSSE